MHAERYVGEGRALRQFLRELRPLVAATLGPDALLGYRIDRALSTGDLPALRAARAAFHNQPEDLKRQLTRGIFETPTPAKPSKSQLLEQYTAQAPEPFVRFDAYPAARADDLGLSIELEHQLCEDVPVRVLISPGTLPASAAQALRHIAARIEADRRLLSARHWQGPPHQTEIEIADLPATGMAAGDNADQA